MINKVRFKEGVERPYYRKVNVRVLLVTMPGYGEGQRKWSRGRNR